jgi:hypothetical protein
MASNRSIDPARPFEQYRELEKRDEPGAPLMLSNNKKRTDPFLTRTELPLFLMLILSFVGCDRGVASKARADAADVRLAGTNAPPMGTLAYLDWKNGFRDLHFRDVISNRADMARTYYEGYDETYWRASDDLYFEKVMATRIVYIAHLGELYRVDILVPKIDQYEVRDIFIAAYGKPRTATNSLDTIDWWNGKSVYANLSQEVFGESAVFSIEDVNVSTQIFTEKYAREKAATAEAAKGL